MVSACRRWCNCSHGCDFPALDCQFTEIVFKGPGCLAILRGSNRRVLVTFSKILLDVFKLDLLDQHGWSKFQKRKNLFFDFGFGLINVAPNYISLVEAKEESTAESCSPGDSSRARCGRMAGKGLGRDMAGRLKKGRMLFNNMTR